jgi:uncharacterized protein involved in type VI secretion and phage assembly
VPTGRTNGIVVGVVKDLDDDAGLGRVRVAYPHLDGELSQWARVVSLMAGKERGAFFIPEVEDEVLVAFEHGDPRRPYVLGGVWSTPDKPPPGDGKPTENNLRLIRSRSEHLLVFDDTDGQERIELIASGGRQTVVLDSAANLIQVTCDQGDVEVTASQGKVTISAMSVEITATNDLKLEAGGTLTVKGTAVKIN